MPTYQSGTQQVLPDSDYEFTVDDAIEKESSKNNPMIELQLGVEYKGGKIRVFDHLVFTVSAFWKIDAFRVCTGETLDGEKVTLEAEDCVGRRGRCHLVVDSSYNGKTRNKVGSYLPPETSLAKAGPKQDEDDIDF